LCREEEYRLEADTRFTEQWPQFAQYQRIDQGWYLISEVTLNTHVGTHIELPYHHCREGLDAATFPLSHLIGEAAVVDISAFGQNDCIDLAALRSCVGDRLRPGDIAFLHRARSLLSDAPTASPPLVYDRGDRLAGGGGADSGDGGGHLRH
jgi:arylformamidase